MQKIKNTKKFVAIDIDDAVEFLFVADAVSDKSEQAVVVVGFGRTRINHYVSNYVHLHQ